MIDLRLFKTFLTMGIVILAQACSSAKPEVEPQKTAIYEPATKVRIVEPNSNTRVFPLTKEKALRIANDHWMKEGAEVGQMIVCNAGLLTRVISVPSMDELVIDRKEGVIYQSHKLVCRYCGVFETADNGDIDTPDKAVDLSVQVFQRYFKETVGGDVDLAGGYFAAVCDLGNAWRIDFYLKEINSLTQSGQIGRLPNHNPPDFVIEKGTGRVLYFNSRDEETVESFVPGSGASTK